MSDKFVILHHRLADGEHWDLMLEHGGVLLTWQLRHEPVDRSSLPLRADRICDHRKAYLTYEGPVSGGRGNVRRVDEGTVSIEELYDSRLAFELRGGRLSGCFTLIDDDGWTLAKA